MNSPKIGIIGIKGQYGQWLERFFKAHGYKVWGSDIGTEHSNEEIAANSDVLIFSVPIRYTVPIINSLIKHSKESQLWMDITSVKQGPVEAMLKSKAEVLGLHPMCAPTVETLKGQVMMICEARLDKWQDFAQSFLEKTQATIKKITPKEHDHQMAVVQDLPHASILVMAAALRKLDTNIQDSLSATSPFYRIVWSLMSRILAQNPNLYADIQFHNPQAPLILKQLEDEIRSFREAIENGDREHFMQEFAASAEHFGEETLKDGYDLFDGLIAHMVEGEGAV
jgi:prephenate dehydrogenase